MIRTLPLEPQPTARQTREILFHVGHELAALGARVDHSLIGGFRFRMPPAWKRVEDALRPTDRIRAAHGDPGQMRGSTSRAATKRSGRSEARPELAKRSPKFFAFISSGRVTIGANAGEPWQVRYELKFTGLLLLVTSLSVMLILLGVPAWARVRLLDSQLALWIIAYALPYLLADTYFRRWLKQACAAAPVTRAPPRGSV